MTDLSKIQIDTSSTTTPADGGDNSRTTVTQLPGGVQRVSFAAAPDRNPIASDILRSGVSDGSALRMDAQGNVQQFGGFTRNIVMDDRASSANILDTARSVGGSRHGRVTDSHTIIVEGTELSVGAAVQMGLLRRTDAGGYEVTGKALQ